MVSPNRNRKAAALPCPPGAPWTCSGRRALQPAGNAMFSDVILLGLSYGMLSSCQHCSLAHSALSSPHLCFPPESWGSSQVLPCQALLTTQAPAPLELFPAPVPAHSHVFFFFPKLLTTAQSLPAAFRGGLTLPSPRWRLLHGFEWDWVLQRVLFKGSLQLQAPVLYYCILSHFWQSSL